MSVNGTGTRDYIKEHWIPLILTTLLSGGAGGLAIWSTVPKRLDIIEIVQANESTYLRSEMRKLGLQIAHATCIAEAALDTIPIGAETLSRRDRRLICEEVDRRVQDVVEEQVNGR